MLGDMFTNGKMFLCLFIFLWSDIVKIVVNFFQIVFVIEEEVISDFLGLFLVNFKIGQNCVCICLMNIIVNCGRVVVDGYWYV